jgi:hypothetical protein
MRFSGRSKVHASLSDILAKKGLTMNAAATEKRTEVRFLGV